MKNKGTSLQPTIEGWESRSAFMFSFVALLDIQEPECEHRSVDGERRIGLMARVFSPRHETVRN